MFNIIKYNIKKNKIKKQWRLKNSHNETSIRNVQGPFLLSQINVGNHTYGYINASFFGGSNEQINIGAFCSIAFGVYFVCGGEHNYHKFTTYPLRHLIGDFSTESQSKGEINIMDDVWLGHNAIVLSGVTIGQGAVVAAGALVVNDVPPYSIVGGVPAKVIKYRFTEDVIQKLLNVDYSKISEEMLLEHKDFFNNEITEMTDLNWLPRK